MSYKQKCLKIDSGMWCERTDIWGYFVYTELDEITGRGASAAAAWKNAWERLTQEMPG